MEGFNSFVDNWGATLGVIAAGILFFERLARITPTETDDKWVGAARRIFSLLSVNLPDNLGKKPRSKEHG